MSEVVQKTAKKLLIELKRVYPDDTIGIIKRISSKNARNWWYKILDYELESESEDELLKPVQKLIEKQHHSPSKKKIDDDYMNIPKINEANYQSQDSYKISKSHNTKEQI